MFPVHSHAKLYVLATSSVLVLAGGIVVGHGLMIAGLGLAAWAVRTAVRDHGRSAGPRPSSDR